MKTKAGVRLAGLHEFMRPALKVVDRIYKKHGKELVITSTLDGVHSAGSLHPYGKAFDCRIFYFNKSVRLKVYYEIKLALGIAYDVVLEGDHIHVECVL